jgi:hypothetical protein
VSKIRVSTKNAINNIKELKTKYFLESNGMNYNPANPANPAMTQNHPSMFTQGHGTRVTTPSYNAINHIIQPELPFNTNLQNRRPRDFGGFLPQNNTAAVAHVNHSIAAAAAAAAAAGSTKVYQVNKQTQNVVIPLQRPASMGSAPNIHQQKRFGMRAMFM